MALPLILAATQLMTIALVLRHLRGKDRETTAAVERLAALADPQAVAVRLVETVEREREARRDEIQTLLQRIQAPERAVIEHGEKHAPDDGAATYPLSEEETVQAQDARLQALTAIEQLEREEAGSLLP